MAAYSTLYIVLLSYIKVLSPVIPFISDEMYENLVCSFDENAYSSIHLTEFPTYNESLVDENLILEIDTVKQIVSFGRSARNKANLKIRQPLKKVKIYLKQKNDKTISNYNTQILQELNVKNVEFVKNENDIVHFELKPNFNVLGKKYGKEISRIVTEMKKLNVADVISTFDLGNSIKVCDEFDLLEEDFEIIELASDNYSFAGDQNIKVAVCCALTDNLIKEGIVRDVVRKVQNLRKESDFEVNDRVSIALKCSDHIFSAINENKDYFKNETLCKEIEKVEHVKVNPNSFNLDSEIVEIGIKKL